MEEAGRLAAGCGPVEVERVGGVPTIGARASAAAMSMISEGMAGAWGAGADPQVRSEPAVDNRPVLPTVDSTKHLAVEPVRVPRPGQP